MANEEVIYKIIKSTVLPGGEKMLRGTLLVSNNYYTGGAGMNVANDLKATGSPTVAVFPADGYIFEHDQGTASAGKLQAFYSILNGLNGANFNTSLKEVIANTDLSAVNAIFIAIGQAY